ncbi:MAG: type II toxin-antitoxin system Phd/YefM family antitoxin [Proteobacteria bacterium]|nr:type II toxin-antitoxin system Phd/YefM family antitoxin [Pseudomonadota bacterium]
MTKVTIHVAKTNLSKLIAKVEAGEEVVICRGNKEVAKLVAANDSALPDRKPGNLKGIIEFDERFFDPLPPHMTLKPTKTKKPSKNPW